MLPIILEDFDIVKSGSVSQIERGNIRFTHELTQMSTF